jgi:DeoR family fructose operon transcriptional repressor
MVENIHFTKCFLGTDGIAENMRFTAMDFQTASLNSVIMRHSSCRVIMFDHSKFSSTALVAWGSVNDVDVIITDRKSDSRELAAITSAGKRLVTV